MLYVLIRSTINIGGICYVVIFLGCCWLGARLRGVGVVCPVFVSVPFRLRSRGLVPFVGGGGRVRPPLGVASPGGLPRLRRPAFRGALGCLRPGAVRPSLARVGGGVVAALVGFSGSRSLSGAYAGQVSGVVASVAASGRGVAVGCAPGLDALVRQACSSAQVWSVSSGLFGAGRSAFARRSAALVAAVAASGAGAGLLVFPAAPCPFGLLPSPSSSACFCGLGSGSWASAAFAAGLGLPVVVFPCGFSALPASWGAWSVAGAGCWLAGFRLSPRQVRSQLPLF